MRRFATAAITAAGITVMLVALPGAASAATGVLYINQDGHEDPVGCINAEQPGILQIENYTDQTVTVYELPNCQGEVVAELAPNTIETVEQAASVRVP